MTPTITQADRDAAAECIAKGVSHPLIQHVLNGDKDEWFFVQAFAAHREAGKLAGVQIGLEAAAQIADEWRDENLKNVSKSRNHANMSDLLEGAAIECNALAGEFRKTGPAEVFAQQIAKGK